MQENDVLAEEQAYLERTLEIVREQLKREGEQNDQEEQELLDSRRRMWQEEAHSADDFDRLTEFNQSLAHLENRTQAYYARMERLKRLYRMERSPYFARVDFTERGQSGPERIYIGRSNLMDDESYEIYVYDWRSPIAGVFYRFECGEVFYEAPGGTIYGDVSLKRQYEIKEGVLRYFFDADIEIGDAILRGMLAQNASRRMKSIVETIQRDQDRIIRDTDNDLLLVQGAAGSGKTSVALHRVAYLMYRGLNERLNPGEILLISPNRLFSDYIGNVLPDLGEENVSFCTFEELGERMLSGCGLVLESRDQLYERIMGAENLRDQVEWKGSQVFLTMLRRLCRWYERRLIPFTDIYYDGCYIADRRELRELLQKRNSLVSPAARLLQMEEILLGRIRDRRGMRLQRLEQLIERYPEHAFEVKPFARLMSMRESKVLAVQIKRFTEIDYLALYRRLFRDKALFYRMAKGLKLPEGAEGFRRSTLEALEGRILPYADMLAVLFLKITLGGQEACREIKQVVLDEAQDDAPVHFELLRALYPAARFTILGDVNQTVGKLETLDFYEGIKQVWKGKKTALLVLEKSFRSTKEIADFSARFLGKDARVENFGRSGGPPRIYGAETGEELERKAAEEVAASRAAGYASVAILTKSRREAEALLSRLAIPGLAFIDGESAAAPAVVGPIYMAKGLEFDSVLVYGADKGRYASPEDRKLLYVASTRALHRLSFFYEGEISELLKQTED